MKQRKSFFNYMMVKVLLACLLIQSTHCVFCQPFPLKNYPQNYFRWPLGSAPGIVANFGELRPNHYHMGLDCRTDQKENQPVYAAAAGYIAKIKVERYGFGQAIYINHPNGLTTLYGHLNSFYPELDKYVKEQQYKQESWEVFLDIPADLFPVTQGQLIALSGNTGGSQGPHLHFEIRDTKTDKCLNPSLFNFPLPDTRPPDIMRLAMYDRTLSVYEQTPKFFTLKKTGGVYSTVPALITANSNKVSFAITSFDAYNANGNRNGIYEAVLYDEDKPVVGFQLDSISYDETRELNGHIDYKLRNSGGPFTEHLSKLPGYPGSVYTKFNGDGVIALEADSIHHISINVKDANGNTSLLCFDIKRGFVNQSKLNADSTAFYDPKIFHPGFINVFENDNVRFYLDEGKLYDSIRFTYSAAVSKWGSSILLKNGNTPVHGYFPVSIYSTAFDSAKEKVVMERSWNGKTDFVKTKYNKGWYTASFRELGNFRLFIDNIPPVIRPVGFKDGMNAAKLNRIAFVITDNSEELTFKATLDGKWLRFSNDKGKTFIYRFDELCPEGEHELKIYAEDQVGNSVEKVYKFTR